jgi:hypothetical protein
MRVRDIKPKGRYLAHIRGRLVEVIVEQVELQGFGKKLRRKFIVTEVGTGLMEVICAAASFRERVS